MFDDGRAGEGGGAGPNNTTRKQVWASSNTLFPALYVLRLGRYCMGSCYSEVFLASNNFPFPNVAGSFIPVKVGQLIFSLLSIF
jgi:hypothetical protein